LPGKRLKRDFLHDAGLPLPFSPSLSFHAIFEDPIAGCLSIIVCDDHSPVVMLSFSFAVL
jgi:hypothetical protein